MGDETGAKRFTGMDNSHGDRPQIRDATPSPVLCLGTKTSTGMDHGSWSPQHTQTLDYDTS